MRTGEKLAGLLDVPVELDSRLVEVKRPIVRDDAEFTLAVDAYLRGQAIAGWEPQEAVVQRMLDAVLSGLEVCLVGLVSHGTAMSLLLEHLGLVDASGFWATLQSPDAWLVDGPTPTRLDVD